MICPRCRREFPEAQERCPTDRVCLCEPEDLAWVGRHIGGHVLEEILGVGGMGVVYRGRHLTLGREVAVKILGGAYRLRASAARDMLREAQAASRLNHPHIISVTDFGTAEDGTSFFVMEYLEGEDLRALLNREGKLTAPRATRIIRQIASALGAAHRHGIVHRDLKPENIFLVRVGDGGLQEEDFVKVLDFGLAKVFDMEPSARTKAGVLAGTPHFMSPEQVRNLPLDGRSDLYSLGVLFYLMTTGHLPFNGSSVSEVLLGHLSKPATPPSQHNQAVEGWVDEVILRCLDKDPRRRYSAEDLILAIRRSNGSGLIERPPLPLAAPAAGAGGEPEPALLAAASLTTASCDPLARASSLVAAELSATQSTLPVTRPRRLLPLVSGLALGIAVMAILAVAAVRPDAGRLVAASHAPSASRTALPAPSPPRVAVHIVGAPAHARVYLDGVLTSDRPLLLRASSERHRVRVEAAGHQSEERVVTADAEQRLHFTIALARPGPRPPAAETAETAASRSSLRGKRERTTMPAGLRLGKHKSVAARGREAQASPTATAKSATAKPATAKPATAKPATAKQAAAKRATAKQATPQGRKYENWVIDPD